jgi:hypothetical protein
LAVERYGADWLPRPENVPLLPNWVYAAFYYMLELHEAAGADQSQTDDGRLWIDAEEVREEFAKMRKVCDFAAGYLTANGHLDIGQKMCDRLEGFGRYIEGKRYEF